MVHKGSPDGFIMYNEGISESIVQELDENAGRYKQYSFSGNTYEIAGKSGDIPCCIHSRDQRIELAYYQGY